MNEQNIHPENEVDKVRRILAASLNDTRSHLNADEELFPYVDGKLRGPEREIVESHLDDCEACRSEVAELTALRHAGKSGRLWQLGIAAGLAIPLVALGLWWRAADPGRDRSVDSGPPPSKPRAVATGLAPPSYANPEWTALVAAALDQGRLPDSSNVFRESRGTVRGVTETAEIALAPSGTAIDTERPHFTWPPAEGASYVVSVVIDEQNIVTGPSLRTPRWTCDRALQRGRSYVWQVEVFHRDGRSEVLPAPPAPPARFYVLSGTEHAELLAATTGHPHDHLLLAVLYSRFGMQNEAAKELRQLATRSSESPAIDRLIRQSAGRDAGERGLRSPADPSPRDSTRTTP
jgi:anti-sigma factor RsiW